MPKETIKHTPEEIGKLKLWFNEHADKLPKEMQIDESTYTPDLQLTLSALLEQAEICCENPKMQGSIFILEKIKKKLEADRLS